MLYYTDDTSSLSPEDGVRGACNMHRTEENACIAVAVKLGGKVALRRNSARCEKILKWLLEQ
jgi:hypothetical protein